MHKGFRDYLRANSQEAKALPGVPASMEQEVPADASAAGPVDTGARVYLGPTIFDPGVFPQWLYDGVARIERTDLAGEDGGHPVGSTEPGILVDYAEATLACVLPYWDGADADSPCSPILLARARDKWYPSWGMGTDDFLQPGSDMEVFQAPDFSTGRPTHLALAGRTTPTARSSRTTGSAAATAPSTAGCAEPRRLGDLLAFRGDLGHDDVT